MGGGSEGAGDGAPPADDARLLRARHLQPEAGHEARAPRPARRFAHGGMEDGASDAEEGGEKGDEEVEEAVDSSGGTLPPLPR